MVTTESVTRTTPAQYLRFAPPSPELPADLYVRCTGPVARHRDAAELRAGAALSGDTYFGRFPAAYWQRWTSVREVRLTVTCAGVGVVRLMAADRDGLARTVAVARADGVVVLTAPLDRFGDGGALWLEAEAGHDSLHLSSARWSVSPERPAREAAVVLPTFDRPAECVANLLALAGTEVTGVYVVDQGRRPVTAAGEFPQAASALGDRLHVVRQRNLGGTGGFARGLHELPATADAVFLDDDAVLEPDTITRLTEFAAHAPNVVVGAQFLRSLHPDRLLAEAETVDLAALLPGRLAPGALADVPVTGPRQQNGRHDADYNGWWCCLVPATTVRAIGYPMPMFLKWDDIEYALRAREAGHPTVTLPGAAVWHPDLDWKDRDSAYQYFAVRNGLVTTAVHTGFHATRLAGVLAERLLAHLISMRYDLAEATLLAVNDFLAGPAVLLAGGDATSRLSTQPSVPAHRTPHGARTHILAPPPKARVRTALRLLVRHWRGRADGAAAFPAAATLAWWQLGQYATAVVTTESGGSVQIRQSDATRVKALTKEAARVLLRLARKGSDTAARYRTSLPALTATTAWRPLFTPPDP